MIWNNCKLVYNALTGEATTDLTPKQEIMLSDYKVLINQCRDLIEYNDKFYKNKVAFEIHAQEHYNVWYDLEDEGCFSSLGGLYLDEIIPRYQRSIQTTELRQRSSEPWHLQPYHVMNSPRPIAMHDKKMFLTLPKEFAQNERFGLPRLEKRFRSYFEYDEKGIFYDEELIWEENKEIEKFKDKKILIIGAGPSANMVDYDKVDYDYVWSCNHFFNHDKISNLNLDLVYFSNDSYHKKEAIKYVMNNDKVICAFDFAVNRDAKLLLEYKRILPGRTFLYNARLFTTTSGVMPRLVCLATLLGAKEVLFAGMDGQTKDDYITGNSRSIFQEGKKIPKHQRPGPLKWHAHNREFVLFWDYMLYRLTKLVEAQGRPMTRFKNLGEGYEHNMTADISRQMFRLENDDNK